MIIKDSTQIVFVSNFSRQHHCQFATQDKNKNEKSILMVQPEKS